jgi:hypothetical protein
MKYIIIQYPPLLWSSDRSTWGAWRCVGARASGAGRALAGTCIASTHRNSNSAPSQLHVCRLRALRGRRYWSRCLDTIAQAWTFSWLHGEFDAFCTLDFKLHNRTIALKCWKAKPVGSMRLYLAIAKEILFRFDQSFTSYSTISCAGARYPCTHQAAHCRSMAASPCTHRSHTSRHWATWAACLRWWRTGWRGVAAVAGEWWAQDGADVAANALEGHVGVASSNQGLGNV